MKATVYDYRCYKKYLNDRIDHSPQKGRGLKLKMANFLSCQTAYISQVLRQDSNFNLEQAVKLNGFWKHSKKEGRFFLILLQKARAGTQELRNYFQELMDEIILKRSDLKERVNIKNSLEDTNQHIYYSTWSYAAIHIMSSIEKYQNVNTLSERLRLPVNRVQEILEFLVKTGLISQQGNSYKVGVTRIHLSQDSVQIRHHHANWRNRAIISIDQSMQQDLHYSNVISMARSDIPKVKEILLKSIEECREIIKESKEEELQILCMDFFTL